MKLKSLVLSASAALMWAVGAHAVDYTPERIAASVSLKVPGNPAVDYPLTVQASRTLYRVSTVCACKAVAAASSAAQRIRFLFIARIVKILNAR